VDVDFTILMTGLPTFTVSALALFASLPTLNDVLKTMNPTPPPQPEEVKVINTEETPKTYQCMGCNKNENTTLAFFQSQGITDKNALATVMGNIKQESKFIPNICEGGSRTHYSGCRSGGYGLIQWTSTNRYYGLGRHANRLGTSPSTLNTQLSYLIVEPQWTRIEHKLKAPGKSIEQYMNYAYSWLGWGIHGARTHYAYDYRNRLTLA